MIRHAVIITAFIVGLCGCVLQAEDSQAVRAAITQYNALLAEGYARMNMNGLAQVTTMEQATKVYHHMAALGEAGTRMVSTLKDMRFSGITFPSEGKAVATTVETWDFAHLQVKTDKLIGKEKDFRYTMKYQLKKDGERWLVTDAVVSDGTRPGDVKRLP